MLTINIRTFIYIFSGIIIFAVIKVMVEFNSQRSIAIWANVLSENKLLQIENRKLHLELQTMIRKKKLESKSNKIRYIDL